MIAVEMTDVLCLLDWVVSWGGEHPRYKGRQVSDYWKVGKEQGAVSQLLFDQKHKHRF